jgi:hypothetical protein
MAARMLRPLLRAVQDADNLDRFLSYAINNQERETGDHQLPRVGVAIATGQKTTLVRRKRGCSC